MTKEQENVQIVQQMFAGFDQRNLPAVLDTLAEDVYWQSPVTRAVSREILWTRPRHGREQVATFFKELFEAVQPERLEALQFTAQDDRVIVEGKNRGTVNSTGKNYEHDWVMVLTVRDGKITKLKHYYDTADILAAFKK